MKGVLLCGGSGSRLGKLTAVNNKHLLPMGDKLMLDHPLNALVNAGISEILIVTGYEHAGKFVEYLGDGSDFNCDITYRFQKSAGGIAQALGLAENFVGDDSMCVILGDNIFTEDLTPARQKFERTKSSAMIMYKHVHDPSRYGVCVFKSTSLVAIEEKPKEPKSDCAVIGVYFYDNSVFNVIKTLKPSGRGELEITDVNNHYLQIEAMEACVMHGHWTDAGTHESYWRANRLLMEKE